VSEVANTPLPPIIFQYTFFWNAREASGHITSGIIFVAIFSRFHPIRYNLTRLLAVLGPTIGNTMYVLSPFISVLWYSD